ncbi:MAG: SAM-dependent methyltransferase [Bacteroidota bacterium]
MEKGTIYLLPTLLSDSHPESVLPPEVVRRMHALRFFAVENIRTARRYLIKSGMPVPVDEITFVEYSKKTPDNELMDIMMEVIQGKDLGVLSESGLPCIADPGSRIVEKAHQFGVKTVPFTGPSSILLGLMASGFSGQSFSFHGYLPIDDKKRDNRLRLLEKLVYREDQTQIFIETPYRNMKMFKAMLKVLSASTRISLGIELTGKNEQIMTYSVGEWKKMKVPPIHKRNVIFLIYK